MLKNSSIKNYLKIISENRKQIAVAVICLLVLAILCVSGNGKKKEKSETYYTDASEYTELVEKKLEKLLSEIDGAGEVSVMITLESTGENVYATEKGIKTKNGDSVSESDESDEYVTLKKGASNEECVILESLEPKVRGVAVIAQGADNIQVKKAMTETVCAVLDIGSSAVSVEKMKNKKELKS